jgi:hypothetical protein
MSQLTPHFADTEPGLTVLAGADSHVIENVTFLCEKVLEPIHDKFGTVRVHDSYRDPGHNAQVGGKTASFHLCIGGHAAVDVDAPAVSMQVLFDWLRLESKLPFDKVIFEKNKAEIPACVHISRSTASTHPGARHSLVIPAQQPCTPQWKSSRRPSWHTGLI